MGEGEDARDGHTGQDVTRELVSTVVRTAVAVGASVVVTEPEWLRGVRVAFVEGKGRDPSAIRLAGIWGMPSR